MLRTPSQHAVSFEEKAVAEQGGSPFHIYSTDMEGIFRQEGYFHYLFGVEEEDFFGAIDIRDGRSMLFMPRLPDSYAVSVCLLAP